MEHLALIGVYAWHAHLFISWCSISTRTKGPHVSEWRKVIIGTVGPKHIQVQECTREQEDDAGWWVFDCLTTEKGKCSTWAAWMLLGDAKQDETIWKRTKHYHRKWMGGNTMQNCDVHSWGTAHLLLTVLSVGLYSSNLSTYSLDYCL